MSIPYKTYEKAEEAALKSLEASVIKWNGTSYTNHYVVINENKQDAFTFIASYAGCHGWLASNIGTNTRGVFTSLKEREFPREEAVKYWEWMTSAKASPWRNFLAKHPAKMVAGEGNRLFAFGFSNQSIKDIPLQVIANIFVATRTPLEKGGYLRLWKALEKSSFTQHEKRYLCSIAQMQQPSSVTVVDGFHFPFNTHASVDYWKFTTGNITVRPKSFGPVNNFWHTDITPKELSAYASVDSKKTALRDVLFTRKKRVVKSLFNKAVTNLESNAGYVVPFEEFIENVLANRDKVFDMTPNKLQGEHVYESAKKEA